VDSWLDLNVELAARWDVPAERARTHARLGLAVIRGLLLDLLATGDRAGTDAALEEFAANYEAGLPRSTGSPTPGHQRQAGRRSGPRAPADGSGTW
jgi:hypothetical protein